MSHASQHSRTTSNDAALAQSRVARAEAASEAGGIGNLAIAQHFHRGAPGAAFPGAPLDNQQQLGRARVQRKCTTCEDEARRMGVQAKCNDCAAGDRSSRDPSVVPTAVAGVSGASAPLPHLDRIRSSFGRHDVSHVRASVGGDAGHAAGKLGAAGYTVGDRVAFRSQPDVRLAAHEAAHVVQQRSGLKLDGDVGTPGDRYERAADVVADAVAEGRSAEHLLDDVNATAMSGITGPKVQMQLWAHTQHPGMPAYPKPQQPPAPNCDQHALAALQTEIVELQGEPLFKPSRWIDKALWCMHPLGWYVHAKFGSLASGVLKVRAVPQPTMQPAGSTEPPVLDYETVDDQQFLELHHPSFPGGGFNYPPRLRVTIANSKVTGFVSFSPGGGMITAIGAASWVKGFAWEKLLGLGGLTKIRPHGGTNILDDGKLDFVLSGFEFNLEDTTTEGGVQYEGPDSLGGTGTFEVHDATETFTADAKIEGDGIAPGKMSLRKVAERISGSGDFSVTLAPKDLFGGSFAGSIKGNYAGGQLTLVGNARYSSKRLNGSVTVMLAPRAVAWKHVLSRLPSGQANSPTISFGAAMAPGYVVVGWGTVDFAINEWLTGSVSAVVDPEGYITSFGVLRPTKRFQFLTDEDKLTKRFDIAHLEAGVTIWRAIPLLKVVSVDGTATADIWAQGRVGPGLIYDLEVAGTFSSRPGTVFEASATGKINLSAWAQIKAKLAGKLDVNLGVPVFNVSAGTLGVEGTATATLKAFVELKPTFERIASPTEPDKADYRISGTLDAAGALDFGLGGAIFIDVAKHRMWTVNLGSYEWRVGSLGMQASFSHVIGSNEPIDLSFTSAEFDDSKFHSEISDLANKEGDKNSGKHDTELEQDAATKPPPTPDMPTIGMHAFKMNGVDHSLWIEHEPAAVIKMASDGDDSLRSKLAAEDRLVQTQKEAQSGAAAAELADEQAEVRRIAGETRGVEHRLNELQSEARQAGDVAGFSEIADELTAYGAQYQKSDLAQPVAEPTSTVTIENGRYVIKSKADLDAVRAVAPNVVAPAEGADPAVWKRYAGTYFPGRLAEFDSDFAKKKSSTRKGPQTWEAYTEGQGKLGHARAQKEFQPELRNMILDDNPGIDPKNVEIDVGVSPTRRGVPKGPFYADVVVSDPTNKQIEVYSAKVHDVAAAKVGRDNNQIKQWIDARMSEDVDEAAQNYGYEIDFRRQRQSTPAGRAGSSKDPKHPLYGEKLYVTRVNLVWKYSRTLIPDNLLPIVEDAGEEYGVRGRKTKKVQVRFLLRPQP